MKVTIDRGRKTIEVACETLDELEWMSDKIHDLAKKY